LLFDNVDKRIELHRLLETLYQRYGLIFGDKEGEQELSRGDFDKKAFNANSRRFEQRLESLGVLKWPILHQVLDLLRAECLDNRFWFFQPWDSD